jgi:hypothetical protein
MTHRSDDFKHRSHYKEHDSQQTEDDRQTKQRADVLASTVRLLTPLTTTEEGTTHLSFSCLTGFGRSSTTPDGTPSSSVNSSSCSAGVATSSIRALKRFSSIRIVRSDLVGSNSRRDAAQSDKSSKSSMSQPPVGKLCIRTRIWSIAG